jgi:hypothetical protein
MSDPIFAKLECQNPQIANKIAKIQKYVADVRNEKGPDFSGPSWFFAGAGGGLEIHPALTHSGPARNEHEAKRGLGMD